MKKTVLCYGDSNTYGYDPRDGGRYEANVRWVDLLTQSGYNAINEGLNGREIPTCDAEYEHLNSILQKHGNIDVLILALGVNDAYNILHPTAKIIADRWRTTLSNVPRIKVLKNQGIPIILISPPVGPTETWGNDRAEEILDALKGISTEYKKLCEEEGLIFADANTFGIELAMDGVHFTEKGSVVFYEKIKEIILSLPL